MNHEKAFDFFTSVLKHIVTTDDYPVFKKIGFSGKEFPMSYRSQVVDFERIAEKNLPLAKIKFAGKFGDLQNNFKEINMTSFANNYHQFVKIIRCHEFLDSLRKEPMNAEKLATEFLRNKNSSVLLHDLKSMIEPTIEDIENKISKGVLEIIIPGWEKLSSTIGGFNPGSVFVITAKTGVGKTALALNIAASAAESMNVIYFNMEMLVTDIIKRIFMAKGLMTRRDLSSGNYIKKCDTFTSWFSKVIRNENKLLISDGRALSINELISSIVQENEKNKIGLVVIDYDQKIKTPDQTEQWKELHRAMEEIEEIAKFCELPVILLAQGDDDGNVKASKRITQSATAQFDFYYDELEKKHILEAKKNRHGIFGKKIIVNYTKEMSLCSEGNYYEPVFSDEIKKPRGRF